MPPFVHDWTFPEARAALAIVHGYAEHGARYEHVAQELREHELGAIAIDLRGHGRSPGTRGHVQRFADYHDDAQALLAAARERCPDTPLFLFGHSMGGLVVLDLLASGAELDVEGVVVTSPLLSLARRVSGLTRGFIRLLDRIWPSCPLPTGLDPSLVCKDPELSQRYADDPMVFRRTTPRWFLEAHRAMDRVHAANLQEPPPVLLLMSGDDRVVDADATRRFASRHELSGFEEYADYFHELLNETAERRQPVVDRIAEWITARASTRR